MKSLYRYLNRRHYKKFVKKISRPINPDECLTWHSEDDTFTPVNPDADRWQTWRGKMTLRRLARENQPWWLKAYGYVNRKLFGFNGLFTYILNPRIRVNKMVWYHQRATRGWADCDTWSLDTRLARVMSEMLAHLADHTHTYPGYGEFDTPEKWDAHLRGMSKRFAALKTLDDADDWSCEAETEAYNTIKAAFAESP